MQVKLIIMKGNKMKIKEQPIVLNDKVSKCGIMLVKDNMYIIRDGKRMKLNAFLIKERKES